MEGFVMTAQLLLSLSILIVVHEWGHYITARWFNIKVEKFYLFFDFLFPLANIMNFSLVKYKKGDTEFGVGWFPLGGYVKIAGMVDESMDKEAMKAPAQDWEFRAKKPWQRLIVMLGGIVVNVIVGVLIFIGITWLMGDTYVPRDYVNQHGGVHAEELATKLGFQTGDQVTKINGQDFDDFSEVVKPDVLLSQNSYYTVVRGGQELTIHIPSDFIENFNDRNAAGRFLSPRVPSIVGEVSKFYPEEKEKRETIAHRVKLQAGDRVVEVEGKSVQYQDEINSIIEAGVGDTLSFKVQRGGKLLSFNEDFKGYKRIGFGARGIDKSELASIRYSFGQSMALGTERAFGVIFLQIKAFKKIFSGEISFRKSLSGPIGMAQAYGGTWDWERFWRMTGLLSMVLAFMNLLPIPGLDGGYVVFLLYEMASGKEPNEKVFETALKIGMGLLLILMVFVFYNDIVKLFN